jgi:hypothetical protein
MSKVNNFLIIIFFCMILVGSLRGYGIKGVDYLWIYACVMAIANASFNIGYGVGSTTKEKKCQN